MRKLPTKKNSLPGEGRGPAAYSPAKPPPTTLGPRLCGDDGVMEIAP
jgi:hypothetical protein